MKFPSLALSVLSLSASCHAENHAEDKECTHGKLYIADDATSDIHVFDVSKGVAANMVEETSIALPAQGAGGLVYYGAPGEELFVQYRGEEPDFEGFVRVIDTGFEVEDDGDHEHIVYSAPSIYENAIIDECRRPIHQVRHDDMVAVFCDGAFDAVPPMNTTIYVVDEELLGSTDQSAIVHTTTLEGAHHGVAVPVDDGHLMHSLALPERILRDPNVTSLPSTFQVTDFDGTVLHEMVDTTNADTHCSGFHGSATLGNTIFLACDSVHGGVVIVEYDSTTETYASRALAYPDDAAYEDFRMGSFAYHYKNPTVVGAFALNGGTEFHLVGLTKDSTAIEESNIFTLPGTMRQCAYQFEVGTGEHLLVFMPDGVLHVFEVADGVLTLVMSETIVEGMTTCDEAAFVSGIGQAFVATPADNSLHAIDLSHIEGEIDVVTTTLPFTPTAMTVSGFELEHACGIEHHDHSDGEMNGEMDGEEGEMDGGDESPNTVDGETDAAHSVSLLFSSAVALMAALAMSNYCTEVMQKNIIGFTTYLR